MLEASEYTSGYHKITAKSVVSQTSRDSMQQTSLDGISTSRDAFLAKSQWGTSWAALPPF